MGKAKQKVKQVSNKDTESLTKKYLGLRTPVIFILTMVAVLFTPNQTFLSAFILAIITSIFSFLITNFLSTPINRVWTDRLAFRSKTIDIKSYKPVSTITDILIYAVDYGMTITFPVFACYVVFTYPSIKNTLRDVFFSFPFRIFVLIVCSTYLGLLFFVFKKRVFIFFFILLLSVPLVGLLDFFGDALDISKSVQSALFYYATGMALYLGLVAAFDYFDKGIQKHESGIKRVWQKLVGFIAWDFLDNFKNR